MKLRDLRSGCRSSELRSETPVLAEAGRWPSSLAVHRGPCRARAARARDPGGRRSGGRRALAAAELAAARRSSSPRDQRDGGDRPHEPRSRAARRSRSRPGARGRARVLEPRVRPRRREARLPSGSHRLDPHAADRRGSGARRQQQRSRRAPRARCARGRTRGPRLARRADRDRRRLPDPRRPHALGGAARRGGDDQPHADRRLRGRALGRDGRCILRVHQSNFRLVGFTEQPDLARARRACSAAELPLVDDLGSGALIDLGDEPTAWASLSAGADLVWFSGDKLLGGPQAGIVVGRKDLVERLRRHPLQRALRADKLSLAALEATLALYLEPERARREIPVLRMLEEPIASRPRPRRAARRARRR